MNSATFETSRVFGQAGTGKLLSMAGVTRRLIAASILLWGVASVGFGSELLISAGLGSMADVRAGVEVRFTEKTALQVHAGASFARAVTGDLLGAWRLFSPTERTTLHLLVGATDLLVPLQAQALMVSFGLALEGRWWLSKRVGLSLRVGEGYPIFIENGVLTAKTVRYPFGLWPSLLVSVLVRPRANIR